MINLSKILVKTITLTVSGVFLLAACSSNNKGEVINSDLDSSSLRNNVPVVVTSSAISSFFVKELAGSAVKIVTLVPNTTDTHTYEPAASDLRELENASLVVLPDYSLNPTISQVVGLAVPESKILDLNAASLQENDYVFKDNTSKKGRNVHTWTDPLLAVKWVDPLASRLIDIVPDDKENISRNASELKNALESLSESIEYKLNSIPVDNRKLVVYHDAWEYFGKRYDIPVIGALQAVDFSEPSAGELAAMVDQIKIENVPAFFGSEVFPSDVLEVVENESGARYIPDLADDALPGDSNDPSHSYIFLMNKNTDLIVNGLIGE